MPKIEQIILNEVFGVSSIRSAVPITQGYDGAKFVVTLNDGTKRFCKIRDKKGGYADLPNQEDEILQRVTNEAVIKPLKTTIIRGRPVFVAPFIEGENLQDHIARNGSLQEDRVVVLAKTLFSVAASLRVAGAIHFDIKPANIMVAQDGKFFLVDFGTARFIKKIRQQKVMPARRFIAPEVLQYLFDPTALALQQISILSDMYSIGAVLYSAATGQDLANDFHSSADILHKVPQPIRRHKPQFHERLSIIIEKLVSKEPARRLQPEDAVRILQGEALTPKAYPIFFLKTKGGGGQEHKSMIPTIVIPENRAAIYWHDGRPPVFDKKMVNPSLLWETPLRDNEADLRNDLTKQHRMNALAFLVSGAVLQNPLDPVALDANLRMAQSAIAWRNNMAIPMDVLTVISLDEALLTSSGLDKVKNAYAGINSDGVILRIYAPSAGFSFDARHLRAVSEFIQPWKDGGRPVLLDGDLSALPLSHFGVTGLVSTTYPKIPVLATRLVPSDFMRKPDRFYLPSLLCELPTDHIISLRMSASGKLITNCSCSACTSTLMQRNRLPQWTRTERRRHFIHIIAREFDEIKNSPRKEFLTRIQEAMRQPKRFPLIPVARFQKNLQGWETFLS